ncbi:MAG: DUF1638 domain-containing protein, partial [Deltaproteobacteria bacterium]|nr:DUF1638 domain-containing protein [Deltaproteobacteria bacterium]
MRVHVIACGVMRRELEELDGEGVTFSFLAQGLHQRPETMREPIQEAVDAADALAVDRVVLAYGLCSNGVAGLRAGAHPLVIPRSHDCLGILWGDLAAFEADRARDAGTYYLSEGWLAHGAAPLDKLEAYRGVMDEEDAEWGLREEFRHYTRLVWIDTGQDPEGRLRAAAQRNADFLGLRFEVVAGDRGFLRRLLAGEGDGDCVVL